MNSRTVKHILAVLLVLIPALFLRLSYIQSRPPLEHDEAISYLAAAGKQDDYDAAVNQREVLGVFLPAAAFKEFMLPDRPTNITEVSRSMGFYDYHPPLYYWLLGFWLYLTGLNLQTNLILNVLLAVLTCLLIYAYAYYLTRSIPAAAAVALAFSTGAAATHVSGVLRHYELLASLTVAFVFLLDFVTKEKKGNFLWWILIAIVSGLGLITHIYFFMVFFIGMLFAAVRLFYSGRSLLKNLIIALILSLLLALILFPYYPAQFEKRLTTALEFQQSSTADRLEGIRNMNMLLFGNHSAAFNEYFKHHTLREKAFYVFLLILIGAAAYFALKARTCSSCFPAVFFLLGTGSYIAIYLLKMVPYWSAGGRYLAHLYPFFALSIASLFSSGKARKFAAVFLLVYAGFLGWGSFSYIEKIDFDTALLNYDDYDKVVVAGPSRGYLFRLVYYLSDDAFVYLDYPDNLISEPERWAPFLKQGDAIICIATTKESKEKEREIIQRFSEFTSRKAEFRSGYFGNVHTYVVR